MLRAARMTAAAGLLAVTVTGCTRADIEDKIRFGWPQGVTDQAEKMRLMWSWSSVAALAVGAVVWGLTFWVCAFHRKRGEALPRQTALNLPLEIAYTIVPFLIIAVLFSYTAVIENEVNKVSANPDTTVHVIGFKWNWEFDYLDKPDHTVTAEMAAKGVPSVVNTVGTAEQIPVLVLPVGKTVRIEEEAKDVIHSFWVIDFLFKRDVIPGVDNQFEVTIDRPGAFVGRCAELCGTYHSEMNFEVRAVSWDKYQAYLTALDQLGGTDPDRQRKALTKIGEPNRAVSTYPFDTDRTARQATQKTGG
jgi:cytochrome c oxidase subunit II